MLMQNFFFFWGGGGANKVHYGGCKWYGSASGVYHKVHLALLNNFLFNTVRWQDVTFIPALLLTGN